MNTIVIQHTRVKICQVIFFKWYVHIHKHFTGPGQQLCTSRKREMPRFLEYAQRNMHVFHKHGYMKLCHVKIKILSNQRFRHCSGQKHMSTAVNLTKLQIYVVRDVGESDSAPAEQP